MRTRIFILCNISCFLILPLFSRAQQVTASFSANPPDGCGQISVQFTDLSTGNPTQWNWDFGNGNHSIAENPSIAYNSPGSYTVTLTASNATSQSTYSAIIKVYANPKVSFTFSPPSGCYPLTVQFADSSAAGSGTISGRTWDFGDGTPFSALLGPSHTYDSAGAFPIKLSVTNTAGCNSSTTDTVLINQGVPMDFSADKLFSCAAPATTLFTASTFGNQNVSYQWDFGDGSKGAGQTASHVYTQNGDYTVTLTGAVSGGGCGSQVIKNNYINVGNDTSDFIMPRGCTNIPLLFQNSSTPIPQSATWTFSDGTTLTGLNATHQFKVAGTYQVTLVNNFAAGCTQTVSRFITVYSPPSASFQADTLFYCGTPSRVDFHNLSQGAVSWLWKFGDGDSSADQEPTHFFQLGGNFDITLIAANANGCTDSMIKPGYIHVDAPDLRFSASPANGCAPLATTFSLPGGSGDDIISYDWNFGDGSADNSSPAPSHTYNNPGSYSVSLHITTKAGCKLSLIRDNYIHTGVIPVINFAASASASCLNKPIQFTNQSQPPGNFWIWAFPNDGNIADSTENPLYQFHNLGSQDVTLTIMNNGCSATLTKSGLVTIEPPNASFQAKLMSCSNPHQFQFTDMSVGAQSWLWYFGDGDSATAQNPTHVYQGRGVYRVILTAGNGNCTSSDTGYIRVIDEQPELSISQATVCHGDSVTLSVGAFQSSYFENSLIWYSGAGDSAYITNISGSINQYNFRYWNNGVFSPSLKINYVNGCRDSIVGQQLTVRGPSASFSSSQNAICQGDKVTFISNSQINPPSAAIRQLIWTYGDGTADTLATGSVTHQYTTNGRFNVNLKVTDTNGCSSDTSLGGNVAFIVNPAHASFSTPDTLVCPGTIIHWNNNSVGTGTTNSWDFGDGTTSTAQDPVGKSYSVDSIYTVSLKISTDKGCTDSMVRRAYIRTGTPHAIMGDTLPVSICRLYQDTSINLSKNYLGIRWSFGDGGTSLQDTAYHTYNVPGTYVQKLIVNGYSPGCADSTEKQITIEGPTGTPVMDHASGCTPFTVNFSATNVQRVVGYQWFFGNGVSSNPASSGNAVYTYNQQGLFHPALKLTDASGCYVIVPINDSLNVITDSIGVQPAYSFPSVCDSNQVQFGYTGKIFSLDSLKQPVSYHWDFGDQGSINDVSDSPGPVYRYGNPGTYNALLKISTRYGCVQQIPLTVNIPDSIPLKVVATASPDVICKGDSVQLQASSNSGIRYVWSPVPGLTHADSVVTFVVPDSTSTYMVTAYSLANCRSDTAMVQVIVHNHPQLSAGPDQVATTGSVVQLQATGSNDITQWSWSPPDYLSCTNCSGPQSTPRQNMTYIVTATTGFGCSSQDSMHIFLTCDRGKVFIPNTFTPNGDGINDIFYPHGLGVKNVIYFRIYNRFGQLMYEHTNFQLNDKSAGWDGTFRGQRLDPGVFIYVAAMVCDNNQVFTLSGNVTLLR